MLRKLANNNSWALQAPPGAGCAFRWKAAHCSSTVSSQCLNIPLPFPAVMLLVCGSLVNGPYALITTAVSADLVCCAVFMLHIKVWHLNCCCSLTLSWMDVDGRDSFSFYECFVNAFLCRFNISVVTGHTWKPAREFQGTVNSNCNYWWNWLNRYVWTYWLIELESDSIMLI